jgi:hypothetical protein
MTLRKEDDVVVLETFAGHGGLEENVPWHGNNVGSHFSREYWRDGISHWITTTEHSLFRKQKSRGRRGAGTRCAGAEPFRHFAGEFRHSGHTPPARRSA